MIRRYLPFLLLSALYGCVPVFGTPLSLPPKLEAERDSFEADLDLAFATVNRFAAEYHWDIRAEDLIVDWEVFDTQAALWKRVLELEGLPADTPLPPTGLSATIEDGHLLAVAPMEYQRLHPEYQHGGSAWPELLAHELVHGLHVSILHGNADAMGPTWFYEGLAVVGSGQPFGLERHFDSNQAALAAVKQAHESDYATHAAVVRYFMTKVPLTELIQQAKDPNFEAWLSGRRVALLTPSGSHKFTR
ncbi:MAG: hypothetical protein AB7S68_30490 [Polyangiaceae bacterium]